MEENIQLQGESKEYKYKVDKIERYLSFAALAIFLISFKSSIGMFVFYGFTIAMLVYYFGWFKKKPLYIKIIGEEITINEGLFFKPFLINKSEVKVVDKVGNKLVLVLESGRLVNILSILLSEADFNEIHETFKNIEDNNKQ